MKNVYKFYKGTLEDYNAFKGISRDIESLLDNSKFEGEVSELQQIKHITAANALEEYLSTVHNVNIPNTKKQMQNCNNFKIKEPFNKFRSFSYQKQGRCCTDYYFEEERVLTAYSDGYVCYGGWKSETDYINSSVLELKGVWPDYYERYIVKEDNGSWSFTAKGKPVYWRDFERGCNRLGIEFKYAK